MTVYLTKTIVGVSTQIPREEDEGVGGGHIITHFLPLPLKNPSYTKIFINLPHTNHLCTSYYDV